MYDINTTGPIISSYDTKTLTCAICEAIWIALVILKVFLLRCIIVYSVSPLQNEVTIANRGGFIQAPIKRTKFSWRVLRRMAIYKR